MNTNVLNPQEVLNVRNRISAICLVLALAASAAVLLSAGPAVAQPFDLEKPEPECPPDMSTFRPSSPFFLTWKPVQDFNPNPPDNHRYQLILDPPVPPIDKLGPYLSVNPLHLFLFTTSYHEDGWGWRVRVVEIDPSTANDPVPATTAIVSPLSDEFRFFLQASGPEPPECGSSNVPFTSAPVIISPTQDANLVQRQLIGREIFQWQEPPEYDSELHGFRYTFEYRVGSATQVATNLNNPIDDTSLSLEFVPPAVPTVIKFSVKVVAQNNPNQSVSPDSDPLYFVLYPSYPVPPFQDPDVNGDGEANGIDLFAVADVWQSSVFDNVVLNKNVNVIDDGTVDEQDLLRFATLYMRQPGDPLAGPLPQPMLFDPADQASETLADVNAGNVTLSWGEVPGAQVYEVRILGPRDFLLPVSAPETSVVFPTTTIPGVYQWTVTATAPGFDAPWAQGADTPARILSDPSLTRRLNLVGQ